MKSGAMVTEQKQDAMEALRKLLGEYRSPSIDGMPSFTGGLVGYFSYEMIQYAEPKLHLKESEFDDYNLMLFDKVIAYDHLKQRIRVIVNYRSENGEKGAKRNAVVLYAAACIYIAKKADILQEAVKIAEDMIDSGKALEVLNNYVTLTNEK